ncbi:hypothetical protein YDYSG_04950 [Paenibacillus tyrfis]|uniref:PadR family transcriptional regulator n=1 Tax=Paenibacillus tyrfis TaxID=1501230 RepID=UPI0024931DEA|nr:PadR family transcriptional regulator [Paenibacillus tyrfis]GLI04465.1 hypothetical protein YDYSG_04950 [Paenibacillus tyrfis]
MSTYELLILSVLMHFPLHAYMIAKIGSPWEKISRGTLSTILTKMVRSGFIQEADPADVPFSSDRSSKTYAITAEGRQRFFQLMMDTHSNSNQYLRIFHIKSAHLEFLDLEEQIRLVKHFIDYCQTVIRELKQQIYQFETNPEPKGKQPSPFFLSTVRGQMEVQLEQMNLELAWAEKLCTSIQEMGRNRNGKPAEQVAKNNSKVNRVKAKMETNGG